MAIHKIILQVSLFLFVLHANGQPGLSCNYYQHTCPNVVQIVSQAVTQILNDDISFAASFVRMFFHDCFVRGCDASVLLNSLPNSPAEKAAIPNLTLRGFQQIDTVKAAVEAQCSGIVSCADIIALAAEISVSQVGGPSWQVELGRRDGTVSLASDALANLPPPFFNFSQLSSSFASKGLNNKDLVVLSAAHTIGVSHCPAFSNRLNNADPSLNPQYAQQLQTQCPSPDPTVTVPMDPITPTTFDINYFTLVSQGKGLFQSDAALLNGGSTNLYVQTHKNSGGTPSFFLDFVASMVKMGEIGVLTGNQGEIRNICSAIN